MKKLIAFAICALVAWAAFAEPTQSDRALVEKYRTTVFTTGGRAPDKDFGDQAFYRLPDGTKMWVFDSGYLVVATPDNVEIRISSRDGAEVSRSLELPSGRICTVAERKRIEWGMVKEDAPDFNLPVLGAAGARARLADMRGRFVVLDFWASWCQPCMRSLPGTEALYQRYKDRGVAFYAINIEGDTGRAAAAAKSLGLTLPVLMAEPDGAGEYNWSCRQLADYRVHSIPAVFLVDRSGVIQRLGEIDAQALDEILKD